MKVGDAWSTIVDRTWLATPKKCKRYQTWLLGRISRPPGFTQLVELRAELLNLGQNSHWRQCSLTLALAAELLICSRGANTDWGPITQEPEYIGAIETMRNLRNALCHPAHVKADTSGEPHILKLCTHLENGSREEAASIKALRSDFTNLNQRWVAELALRNLNFLGDAIDGQQI